MSKSAGTRPMSASSSAPQKMMGLEIVRFLAAMAVLIWHYQHFWHLGTEVPDFERSAQPLYVPLRWLYEYGVYGVQVFWCISGYIFFWKYSRMIAEGRMAARQFFILRLSRLYPLHLVTLLLVALLQAVYFPLANDYFVYAHNDLPHFLLQLFMASNWGFEQGPSFNGPIWSISLEVIVYALFFVVMRRLGASMGITCVLIAVGAGAFLLKVPHQVFQCVLCFFIGGLAAQVGRTGWVQARRVMVGRGVLALLLAAPSVAGVLGLFAHRPVIQLFIVAYTPVLLYFLAEQCTIPARFDRLLDVAGNVTYSSYLIHFPIQLMIAIGCRQAGLPIPKESPLFLAAFLGVTLVLSVLVYRYFEVPCQKLIRNRLGRRPALVRA